MSVFKQVLDLQKESSFTAIYITNTKGDKNRSMCLLCHYWSENTADYHLTVDSGIKFLSVLNQLWVINTRTTDHQIGCKNEGKPPGVFGINGKSQHLAALVMSQRPIKVTPQGESELLMHRQVGAEARARWLSELQKHLTWFEQKTAWFTLESWRVFCV